jgi:hypothetical protein
MEQFIIKPVGKILVDGSSNANSFRSGLYPSHHKS